MSQLKLEFGKRLQKLRKEAGLTQEKLADSIDLTVESVSNIERGIHGPKFDNLEKIADILEYSLLIFHLLQPILIIRWMVEGSCMAQLLKHSILFYVLTF